MAIRRLSPSTLDPQTQQELLAGLVAEIRRPEQMRAPDGSPVVYVEESGTPDNYTHWYAIWGRFAGVDSEERSRLLLQAIRETQGTAEALRVTVAMGLTPDEAAGMGLDLAA